MTILLSMLTLDYAGVPTYVLTLSRELTRRGHRVMVYCPAHRGGRPLASQLDVADTIEAIPEPDAILVHHRSCAPALQARFPNVPLVFIAHGVFSPECTPPAVRVDRYIAINEQTVYRLVLSGVPMSQIDLVRDFVDIDRFRSQRPLRESLPQVLFLSNYKRWQNYLMAVDACASLGWTFRAVGSPYGRSRAIEDDINQSDVVISWGRGILEAMACGRAVVSYDQIRMQPEDAHSQVVGDGYLDERRYLESRQHNFGPVGCRTVFTDWRQLARELYQYDPCDGDANRRLAVTHHSHTAGVDAVIASIGKAMMVAA